MNNLKISMTNEGVKSISARNLPKEKRNAWYHQGSDKQDVVESVSQKITDVIEYSAANPEVLESMVSNLNVAIEVINNNQVLTAEELSPHALRLSLSIHDARTQETPLTIPKVTELINKDETMENILKQFWLRFRRNEYGFLDFLNDESSEIQNKQILAAGLIDLTVLTLRNDKKIQKLAITAGAKKSEVSSLYDTDSFIALALIEALASSEVRSELFKAVWSQDWVNPSYGFTKELFSYVDNAYRTER
jgi:hypothetical protein